MTQENLSPAAEKERSLLAQKFKNLKTQFGFQSDLPGGGKAPPRPPKGGIPIPLPVTNGDQEGQPEELYDDVAGNCSAALCLQVHCIMLCIVKMWSKSDVPHAVLCS